MPCSTIMHNTPFTDMNDSEGESQGFGYGAFASGGRVLDLLAALVAQVTIDPDRVTDNIRRSCITMTELADTLVRERRAVVPRGPRDRRRIRPGQWWPAAADLVE